GVQTCALPILLLHHFGSLDALLEQVDRVAGMRLRGAARIAQAIRERTQQILLMRRLTGIALDAPVPTRVTDYMPREPDTGTLSDLVERLRFGPLTRRACLEWRGAA